MAREGRGDKIAQGLAGRHVSTRVVCHNPTANTVLWGSPITTSKRKKTVINHELPRFVFHQSGSLIHPVTSCLQVAPPASVTSKMFKSLTPGAQVPTGFNVSVPKRSSNDSLQKYGNSTPSLLPR